MMKKLKLNLNGVKDILTREQMKKVKGGYGGCGTACGRNEDCGYGCSVCNTNTHRCAIA